ATPPPALHTLSLHDALPIYRRPGARTRHAPRCPCLGIALCRGGRALARRRGGAPIAAESRARIRRLGDLDAGGAGAAQARAPVPDRKSTRLNSSHRTISYAV